MNAEHVKSYLQHLEANGYSTHTCRAYACDLQGLARFCVERRLCLERTTHMDLDAFLGSPHTRCGPTGRPRSDGALNRVRTSLRSFFGWLHDTGQINTNPAARVRVGRHVSKPPVTISPHDQEKLLQALDEAADPLADRDRAMVLLALHMGLRISEIVGLDVADVDLSARSLVAHTKGGDAQVRHLPRRLRTAIRGYLRWRSTAASNSPALFVGRPGHRITARHFRRRLAQWLAKAGVATGITPHVFRHTLATRLLDATGNLRLVQQALGHRSISSTVRYTRVPNKTLIAALERV